MNLETNINFIECDNCKTLFESVKIKQKINDDGLIKDVITELKKCPICGSIKKERNQNTELLKG